jgi:hypothetical protein
MVSRHWAIVAGAVACLVGCGAGAKGERGTPGGTIDAILRCAKVVNQRIYQYTLVTYESGDLSVTCSVSDAARQDTFTTTYRSNTAGALNGLCIVVHDIDLPSFGSFEFVSSPSPTATYDDPPSSSHGTGIVFSIADCINS